MGKVRVELQISAPATDVWNALADYGGIHKFHPNVDKSFVLEGSPSEGMGAQRRCDLSDGKNHVLERVTEWIPGESYTVDIYDGTMPLRTAQATVGVEASSPMTSIAFMEMDYLPKFGIIGRIMDVFMMQQQMNRIGSNVLTGLADFVSPKSVDLTKNGGKRI